MGDPLMKLIPSWGIEVDHLTYGQELPEPGLYWSCHEDGRLAAVGVVALVTSLWEPTPENGVICRSILTIAKDGATAFRRGRTSGAYYEAHRRVRQVSGFSEEDSVIDPGVPLLTWIEADIRAKVDEVRAMRDGPRTKTKKQKKKR